MKISNTWQRFWFLSIFYLSSSPYIHFWNTLYKFKERKLSLKRKIIFLAYEQLFVLIYRKSTFFKYRNNEFSTKNCFQTSLIMVSFYLIFWKTFLRYRNKTIFILCTEKFFIHRNKIYYAIKDWFFISEK